MYNLLTFIQLLLCRLKNKIFILSLQRPEIIFVILLVAFSGLMAALYMPSLLNYTLEVNIGMFPGTSYVLLCSAILPFLIWILKQNNKNVEEISIFGYIFRNYFKYFKIFGMYVVSGTLSLILLYIVLSVYVNILLFQSMLFWHLIGLVLFITSYALALLTNNVLTSRNLIKENRFLSFKLFLIFYLLLFLILPIHEPLGSLWLSESISIPVLLLLLVIGIVLYIIAVSSEIKTGQQNLGIKSDFERLSKNSNHIYLFLILIDIKKSVIFYVLSILFLLFLAFITDQSFVMLDLFQVIVIIGTIGIIFQKVSVVARPLKIIRASNFTFAIWLLITYIVLAILSVLVFFILISLVSGQNLSFILENQDLPLYTTIIFFCTYLSIIVAYLLGDYLGPTAQSISSGIILIISYWVIPEVFYRIMSLENTLLESLVAIVVLFILFLVKWVTIYEYKDSEVI
ncbi:hypothetical protein J2S74_003831 [Evansella vedderi]|uniref:Uncharacterized protein n=1 Tax=Evansella vedderi TaxID=38282 RepID=A0ABT9ZYS7_9BACI|nr:hypothetical protein [Evansella vedderi]MDQ0256411.1 hypothetical protein [Evansella vedderi]